MAKALEPYGYIEFFFVANCIQLSRTSLSNMDSTGWSHLGHCQPEKVIIKPPAHYNLQFKVVAQAFRIDR